MKTTDKYVFFFGGVCSQWYPSKFTIKGKEYNCAEQYMMAQKAIHFEDFENFRNIMNEPDPSWQKAFGRSVKNFNKEEWEKVAKKHVYDANYAKFSQNLDLLDELMSYGDKEIVEASPTDKIWGIGLGLNHPDLLDKSKWKGTNWLGEVIMEVKKDLRIEYNKLTQHVDKAEN
jgi:ribA/ribD-fused uncharacterized protein